MWTQVATIYRSSKKKTDINWFTEWICRPAAAVIVYALQKTRVTPNQLTLLSLVVAAASGAMLLLLPGKTGLLAAIVVFEFSFILDCADGQLARLRERTSPLGHYLDFLFDEIKAMGIFACVAVRLWSQSGDPLYLTVGMAGLFLLASALSFTSFMRRPEYGTAPPPTADGQPAVLTRRPGLLGALVSGLEFAARTVVHYPAYIWIVALFDRLDIYFWAYAAVNGVYVLRCLAQVIWRLGRFSP